MTIPTLISNTQKHDTAVKLEKMYSTISQATKNSELENGLMQSWGSASGEYTSGGFSSVNDAKDWWDTYFLPYSNLAIVKQCNAYSYSECWSQKNKLLNGTTTAVGSGSPYVLVLSDGTVVALSTLSKTSAQIFVDINGKKSPNIVGKDIFYFLLAFKAGKVIVGTGSGSRDYLLKCTSTNCCNKDATQAGYYCGRVIQLDGWQIKDDYPWN